MSNSTSTQFRALVVLAGVAVLAMVVNGKQLAGYATGTGDASQGCEDGVHLGEDGQWQSGARSSGPGDQSKPQKKGAGAPLTDDVHQAFSGRPGDGAVFRLNVDAEATGFPSCQPDCEESDDVDEEAVVVCSGVQPLTSSIVLDTAGTNLETGTVATYLCSVAENDECTTLTIETLISTQYAIECEPNYSESGTEICPNPCGGLVNSNCFYGGGLNNILSVKSSGSSGGGSLWFQPVDSTNGAREVSVAVSVSNLTTANTTDGGDEPSVTTVATVHPPTGDTLSVEADEPNSTGSGERIYTQGEGFEEEYEVKLYHVLNFDDGDSAECYDGGSHHFLSKSKSIVRICDNPF